jgi:hypothetical protein
MPLYQDPINPNSSEVVANSVDVATVSTLLLEENPNRLGFSITNASNRVLFVDFDGEASVTQYGIRIPSNGVYEPPVNYVGEVHGIWNGTDASGKAFIREFI